MITSSIIKMYESTAARPLNTEAKLSPNIAVSDTLTYYSAPISLRNVFLFSPQIVWTGDPTGTLTIEISNDPGVWDYWESQLREVGVGTVPTWTAPASGGTFPANPAGTAGSVVEQFGNLGVSFVRVKYVNASGSGTLKLMVTGKEC